MNELEEAKLRQLFKNRSNCYADADDVVQAMDENCFIDTVKEWQAERIYSEKEVEEAYIDAYHKGYNVGQKDAESHPLALTIANNIHKDKKEWFEQYKKK